MGIYLSSPKTDKVSEDGENEKLRYGLSSMQGWRATMEDAVSTFLITFGSLIAVFCRHDFFLFTLRITMLAIFQKFVLSTIV